MYRTHDDRKNAVEAMEKASEETKKLLESYNTATEDTHNIDYWEETERNDKPQLSYIEKFKCYIRLLARHYMVLENCFSDVNYTYAAIPVFTGENVCTKVNHDNFDKVRKVMNQLAIESIATLKHNIHPDFTCHTYGDHPLAVYGEAKLSLDYVLLQTIQQNFKKSTIMNRNMVHVEQSAVCKTFSHKTLYNNESLLLDNTNCSKIFPKCLLKIPGFRTILYENAGTDLFTYCSKFKQTCYDICIIVQKVFGLIKQLHALDMAHLDIKPSNIVINDGNVKLIDLETVSTLVNGKASITKYTPPVPIEYDELKQGTKSSDLWFLGKTIISLFAICKETLPDELETLVNRMTSTNQEDRGKIEEHCNTIDQIIQSFAPLQVKY